MHRSAVWLVLLLARTAAASQPPEALVAAMDVEVGWLVANSVSSNSSQIAGFVGQPAMYDVRQSLGGIVPVVGPTMALLFTGDVNNIESGEDFDYPAHTAGASDDRATLRLTFEVPDDAESFAFDFYFLTREYPERLNTDYVDAFEALVQNPAFSGQMVRDADGEPASVNSELLVVTSAAELSGTGFDLDGGTGWVTACAPVTPGSTLELAFELHERTSGLADSAVLLDGFVFSTAAVDGPTTDCDPPSGDDDSGDDDSGDDDLGDDDLLGDDDSSIDDASDDDSDGDDDIADDDSADGDGSASGEVGCRCEGCDRTPASAAGLWLLPAIGLRRRRRPHGAGDHGASASSAAMKRSASAS